MSETLSKIPDGLRYYFGTEARLRRSLEDAAMAVFDGWSYEEVITPTVDYFALFERGMGRREAERAFRFMDTDGQLLALRPDVTSLVARAAATLFGERERPLRLCYTAPVFRQRQQSHAEWRRESVQLGCEFIGPGGTLAEMEMLAVSAEILERLNLSGRYRITLNSVEVFNGIAEHLKLEAVARETMRHLMDIRDAAELRRFLDSFTDSEEDAAAFSRLTQLTGKREMLDQARRIITNERSVAALDGLDRLWRIIEAMGLADSFEIDLGDVSGLDYYTGFIFKIYVAGAGTRVGGGGRYDHLISNFGRTDGAVGFVLDLDALTDVLLRQPANSVNGSAGERSATRLGGHDLATLFIEAREKRLRNEAVSLEGLMKPETATETQRHREGERD